MVNAEKHIKLKIFHEATAPERIAKQYKNNVDYYKKNKLKVNGFNSLEKINYIKDLEKEVKGSGTNGS